jgi:leucyl/phenylalanyl-tRNA--protein transferase
LGAVEISRAAYQRQLADAITQSVSITSQPVPSAQSVLQRNTQTS